MSKSEVKRLCYMTYNNFGRAYQHMELIKATIMGWIENGATKVEIVIFEHKAMSDLKKENEELKEKMQFILERMAMEDRNDSLFAYGLYNADKRKNTMG